MKSKFALAAALASVLVLSGCGSSPSSIVETFSQDLAKGDFADAVKYMDPAIQQQLGPQKTLAMLQDSQREIKANGGLDGMKVIDTVKTDNAADVKFVWLYKNGKRKEGTFPLVKVDGNWRVTSK